MQSAPCRKCESALGSAIKKCPFCGEFTRLGILRQRLSRARWYSLLIVFVGFAALLLARGEPGRFLGLFSMLGGCLVYTSARYVDEKIRGQKGV